MGMSAGGSGPRKAMADINVTPLVDVMLVLLIIFMVATPLITREDDEQREVDINLPVTRDNPNTIDIRDTEQLILRIDAQLVVRLGDEVITDCSASLESEAVDRFERCFDEIQALLGQNYRLQQEESLYLLADTTIPYGFVVGAMNRIRLAGVTNVGMVTNPEYLRP
mgnify:CR=1 FL=1